MPVLCPPGIPSIEDGASMPCSWGLHTDLSKGSLDYRAAGTVRAHIVRAIEAELVPETWLLRWLAAHILRCAAAVHRDTTPHIAFLGLQIHFW